MSVSGGTGEIANPYRADAVLVYRRLRDGGPATAVELADDCFPLEYGHEDPLYRHLAKRSLRRVYDAIVWMRHNGVVLSAVPGDPSTVFHLGVVEGVISPLRAVRSDHATVLAEKVEPEMGSAVMDVWHGG